MISSTHPTRSNVFISFSGLRLGLWALVTVAAGCASNPADTPSSEPTAASPLHSERVETLSVPLEHSTAIEAASAGDSEFSGLYNTFELKATILNSATRESILKRQSEYYLWDSSTLATAREKAAQELSSEAVVFLSFFTPERRNDNLSDAKAIWKIYLNAGDRRYVGTAKRDRRLVAELQSLFPYHTRWNSPYLITFPVAMSAIESQSLRLTVTGPLGTRVLEFKENSK